MGAVYLARDERLGRRVALKVLPPELADDDRFRERFLREWRVAAALEHPHVVPIHDAGEADGQLYIAMRYVEGTDLKELIREESPLEPSRTLKIFSQVADALDAAHARGLVHRDVKPANVLLDQAGNSYLCDFGLTKNVSSSSGLTGTGQLVGTLEYIAPEAIRGDPVDGRADQYSLACLLYECLTGEPPGESWPVNTPERAREHFATVRDPIRLVWDVIHDQRRPLDDPDDCVSFLLERLWKLALVYDPSRDGARDFAGFAAFRLRSFGIVDYHRHTNGRTVWRFSTHTYQREIPVPISLDEESDGDDGGGLDTSVAAWGSDPAAGSDPAFRGLVADRDRRRIEDLELLGLEPSA